MSIFNLLASIAGWCMWCVCNRLWHVRIYHIGNLGKYLGALEQKGRKKVCRFFFLFFFWTNLLHSHSTFFFYCTVYVYICRISACQHTDSMLHPFVLLSSGHRSCRSLIPPCIMSLILRPCQAVSHTWLHLPSFTSAYLQNAAMKKPV